MITDETFLLTLIKTLVIITRNCFWCSINHYYLYLHPSLYIIQEYDKNIDIQTNTYNTHTSNVVTFPESDHKNERRDVFVKKTRRRCRCRRRKGRNRFYRHLSVFYSSKATAYMHLLIDSGTGGSSLGQEEHLGPDVTDSSRFLVPVGNLY